jgi:superfamily II DNA/RNA helicase
MILRHLQQYHSDTSDSRDSDSDSDSDSDTSASGHTPNTIPTFPTTATSDTVTTIPSPEWLRAISYSTMIFTNTAAHAQLLANTFKSLGYLCYEYHSLLDKPDREANLIAFRDQSHSLHRSPLYNKILICTDACARGFDIPHVQRVIQAEFALNVVQYLHRIGRCSRGGKQGIAINFFDQTSKDLVKSIRSTTISGSNSDGTANRDSDSNGDSDGHDIMAIGAADSENETRASTVVTNDNNNKSNSNSNSNSIEQSFSRRRGFRQKIKKGKLQI